MLPPVCRLIVHALAGSQPLATYDVLLAFGQEGRHTDSFVQQVPNKVLQLNHLLSGLQEALKDTWLIKGG